MPRPGFLPCFGAKLGAMLAAFAAALLLVACGGSGDAKLKSSGNGGGSSALAAEISGLLDVACPGPYLAVQRKAHGAAEVRRAQRGEFDVLKHRRRLVPPVNWAQDPFHSKRFRNQLASLKWMDVLIYAYRKGDTGALRQARDLALDWIAHNPRRHPTTDKTWFNKVIGDRAPYLAYVGRAAACEGMLSRSQARAFVGSLRQHAAALTSKKVYTPSNHGLFMDYGLTALGKEAPYMNGADRWRRLAPRRFQRTLLHRVYPDEGFWLENSSSYHLAVRLLLSRYLKLARGDAPADLRGLGRRMTGVAGWLIEPDGKRVLLGDSNLKRTLPALLPISRRQRGLEWLPRSGVSVVRTPAPDPNFMLFAATFHNGSHNQADALTVDLFANGERILSDSGLYDKDADPWQVFSRSSYSHSVMTIDGKSFPLGAGKAYGSGLRAVGQGDGWYALEGVNPLASLQGVTHDRLLLYRPGHALVVVDFAKSGKAHSYQRYFQLGRGLTVKRSGGALRMSGRNGFVAQLTTSGTTSSKLKLWKGHKHPLRGLIFPSYRQAVPRTTAEYTAKGAVVDQAATFALDPSSLVRGRLATGSKPDLATVTLRAPGGKPTVLKVSRAGAKLDVSAAGG